MVPPPMAPTASPSRCDFLQSQEKADKRLADYEQHKIAMDAKMASIKQANRQQKEEDDADMPAPEEGFPDGAMMQDPPVEEIEATPVETTPIETTPIEAAGKYDWQSRVWEETNPARVDQHGAAEGATKE